MTPSLLAALIAGLGTTVASLCAIFGAGNLGAEVKTALAAATPFLVAVILLVVHWLEVHRVQAGATVAAAKLNAAQPPDTQSVMKALTDLAGMAGAPPGATPPGAPPPPVS